ncbi:MAG: NAD(P)/FAD-dependent oxidoreductase [Daejeonella sp.]
MDLKSGLPWWLIRNGLMKEYKTLQEDKKTEIVIIGSGITGALAAHFLCEAGVKCIVVDKRMVCTGSTSASTAQLQYEIDTFLYELCDRVGTENAVKSYKLCLESISTLQNIISEMKIECGFEIKSSLYLANSKKDAAKLKKEFEIRRKHGLPVEYLDKNLIKERFNINREAALYNECSAQVDAYMLSRHLLEYHMKNSGLEVYSHTDIVKVRSRKNGIILTTDKNHSIRAKKMVCAPGYESEFFLKEKVMKLKSTYVLVSRPVLSKLWPETCLVWETARPYQYIRTTSDNRVIVGGEDEEFTTAAKRDKKMKSKTKKILKKFHKLFPEIELETDFNWCGVFGETEDGLPYIGEHKDHPHTYFALGYGGNGITFSVIAAEIIRDLYTGKPSGNEKIFKFDR